MTRRPAGPHDPNLAARRRAPPRRSAWCSLAWALTVNYPKRRRTASSATRSTYYGLGHSLADDGDFEFRREDLVRVWREFPSGPEGIFLKRGTRLHDLRVDGVEPPFLHLDGRADPDPTRLYLRQVVPLSAVRRAVRLAASAPTASSCCTRC